MAGLRFAQDSFVAGLEAGTLVPKVGAVVEILLDQAGTQYAAITGLDGAAITGSQLTTDEWAQLPDFIGPDGVDKLWGRLLGQTQTFPIHPRGGGDVVTSEHIDSIHLGPEAPINPQGRVLWIKKR